jgi:hypothetical protein
MGTGATSESAGATSEQRVARLFGLQGEAWMRHANPWSVWTRFAVLPLLAVSVWSRDWIGWWCLVPVALSLVFMVVNPLLFPEPASTRNWASKAVFGERVWADRNRVALPPQFRASKVPAVAQSIQVIGMAVLVYGLVELDLLAVVTGTVLTQTAKAWYLDRMVLLFEHMKVLRPAYAAWESPAEPAPRRRPPAAPGTGPLLLLGVVCLAAAACGGSGGDSAGDAAATPASTAAAGTTAATQACADAAALQASLARLDQLDPPEAGKAGLQAALQDTRAKLDALKASAGDRWDGQIDELDGAVAAFQTTVVGLDGDHLLGQLPKIVRDLERIDRAWTALERGIDQACPTP